MGRRVEVAGRGVWPSDGAKRAEGARKRWAGNEARSSSSGKQRVVERETAKRAVDQDERIREVMKKKRFVERKET